ncbi:MAG: phosphoesterase [Bacteroidia bacterium]|nr:MAG: phosphoesterase [Bacteroidia bacterium]
MKKSNKDRIFSQILFVQIPEIGFLMYDIIGDVHGHADALKRLLRKMDYRFSQGTWQHAQRKAIFVGDFINKGPRVAETINIVRTMVERGKALAILGNHEYNAICYHTKLNGVYLQDHTYKNTEKHYATLQAFENNKDALENHIKWMRSLPLFLDLKELRAVHAAWIQKHVDYLKMYANPKMLTDAFLQKANQENSYEKKIVDQLLKGIKITLPEGVKLENSDGKTYDTLRIKWWYEPELKKPKELSLAKSLKVPDFEIQENLSQITQKYETTAKPVFCGHYRLTGKPQILKTNICCLDYGAAKNEILVAYRWKGERQLSNKNFTFVRKIAEKVVSYA